MYDIMWAANLDRYNKSYHREALERRNRGCKPEETERMWGRESFLRQQRYN
ncbi:hypothetical protein KY363_04895 [Candidatus Woesearchaeota archaeon]|nr:hypothetical protein [Candidatus Woesearchaeota archaeon]